MLCIQKPIRAGDFVKAQKKRDILTGCIAALLIVCAVAARVVTRGHREAAYFLPVSLLRSFIYIELMMWWGVSLWQRIVQTQVRRYLAATAALYSVLYISRIPWIELLAGDMTVVQCLLLAVGIESCIRCGLIQSNTGYRALFEASTIRAEITDEARQAVYAFAQICAEMPWLIIMTGNAFLAFRISKDETEG